MHHGTGFKDLRLCIKQSYKDTACLGLERDGFTYGEAGGSNGHTVKMCRENPSYIMNHNHNDIYIYI